MTKLVLMKNIAYDYETVVEVQDNGELPYTYADGDYIVLSEPVEVEFKKLTSKSLITAEVGIIDRQVTKLRADFEASLTALTGRKQELLAINYDKIP